MTETEPKLMGRERAYTSWFDTSETIVELLRDANRYRDTPQAGETADAAEETSGAGTDGGFVWAFEREPGEGNAPELHAGVRGPMGALEWIEGNAVFIPVDGLNTDWVSYVTWFWHDRSVEPGAEVPIERVYAAVAEFARTGRRPACITWKPAPSFE